MIKSVRHKGLKLFFERGTTKGIRADHVDRLRDRLTVLDAATCLDDIAAGNWRLFFEFRDGNVYLLDYDDYH